MKLNRRFWGEKDFVAQSLFVLFLSSWTDYRVPPDYLDGIFHSYELNFIQVIKNKAGITIPNEFVPRLR